MERSPEARKLLHQLDTELAAASKRSGRSLVWTPQDRAVLGLIADTVNRRLDLVAAFDAAEDVKHRVRLSAEIRLLDGSLARLLNQVHTDVPAPESQTTIKARRAAMRRWHPDAS